MKVDLLSDTGIVLSSVSTSPAGGYTFANVVPGSKFIDYFFLPLSSTKFRCITSICIEKFCLHAFKFTLFFSFFFLPPTKRT